MKLFLISNEFFRSAMNDSFRASVIAPDANAARWLVGQRSARMNFAEVAGASVFEVGEIQNAAEGVLTVEHRSGSKLFSQSEFERREPKTETFYEVAISDKLDATFRHPVHGKETWFALNHNSDILLRRVVSDQKPAGYVGQGYFSNQFVVLQFYRLGRNGPDTWEFKVGGEQFTTDYQDLSQAGLLEIRAAILRGTKILNDADLAESLLQYLWSHVSEEKVGAAVDADIEFFEGQKLWWQRGELADWVLRIPQVIAGTPTIDEENTKPLGDTNCVTLKDAKDI